MWNSGLTFPFWKSRSDLMWKHHLQKCEGYIDYVIHIQSWCKRKFENLQYAVHHAMQSLRNNRIITTKLIFRYFCLACKSISHDQVWLILNNSCLSPIYIHIYFVFFVCDFAGNIHIPCLNLYKYIQCAILFNMGY